MLTFATAFVVGLVTGVMVVKAGTTKVSKLRPLPSATHVPTFDRDVRIVSYRNDDTTLEVDLTDDRFATEHYTFEGS